jgi:hypothetical protein
MRRKQLLMPFMGFASGIALCMMASCGNGPKVTVYVSDPEAGGMEFYNENTGKSGFVKYAETKDYVCFTGTDLQTLMNYCGIKP